MFTNQLACKYNYLHLRKKDVGETNTMCVFCLYNGEEKNSSVL